MCPTAEAVLRGGGSPNSGKETVHYAKKSKLQRIHTEYLPELRSKPPLITSFVIVLAIGVRSKARPIPALPVNMPGGSSSNS